MIIIKRLLISLISIALLSLVALYASGNGFIMSAVKRTYLAGNVTANINDYRVFETRTIATGKKTPLLNAPNYNQKSLPDDFVAKLKKNNTAAFLVLKDGLLVSEHYYSGYNDRSKTNSFSMAKTITTLLLGIAIEEGHITGLDQPITDFIPEFEDDPLGKTATIGHFSLMTSGYEWDEQYYTPFSPTVELLYGDDVTDFVLNGYFSEQPSDYWEYSSASTQIMGTFLLRALQKAGAANNLSEYLSEKIWKPLEMNDDGLWHLDNSDMELVFCCVNTNARNFSKLGLLMLNNGNWNGQQLVSNDFIQEMIKPVGQDYYGLSTWLNYEHSPQYYWFSGHLGQYIIIVPEHNMVIVRVGESRESDTEFQTRTLPVYVKTALDLVQ